MQQGAVRMTAQERVRLIETLYAEGYSCIVRNAGHLRTFTSRGVKDLYRLLREEPELLRGAFVADKVVGKAAAALMILGGVAEVYTGVVSRPASELFARYGVKEDHAVEVPAIINRARTDRCPLEIRCDGLQTPEECLVRIEQFLNANERTQ